jgi:hypothetical protein
MFRSRKQWYIVAAVKKNNFVEVTRLSKPDRPVRPGQDPVRVEHKNGLHANRLSDRKTGGSTCGPVFKILLDFLLFFLKLNDDQSNGRFQMH